MVEPDDEKSNDEKPWNKTKSQASLNNNIFLGTKLNRNLSIGEI